jgi:type VI secretion system protein ImpC
LCPKARHNAEEKSARQARANIVSARCAILYPELLANGGAETMSELLSDRLDRIRRPRPRRMTYPKPASGEALGEAELPFIVGVLADFSGHATTPLQPFRERQPIQIDRDIFNQVLAQMTPGLSLLVPSTLTNDGRRLAVQLTFRSMADFEPAGVARQVEPLCQLLEARNALQQLGQGGPAPAGQTKLVEDRLAQLGLSIAAVAEPGTRSPSEFIPAIDQILSRQLAAILHHPDFQKLEGTWRGLHYLVINSETCYSLKIKVLNVSKKELFRDLDKAVDFDNSQIFKKVFEDQLRGPGGEPYGVLVGDYELQNHPEDIDLLKHMSGVAATAFCPFIAAASPRLFGFDNWNELAKPRDLVKIFASAAYTKWRSLRESEDARFVTLVLPRVLARLPYGSSTKPVEEFDFEEIELDAKGQARPMPHEHYTWMNTAYVLAARITDAFAEHGWCTAIRGVEGGGKVEGLPAHTFQTDDGDVDPKCSAEVGLSNRRDNEEGKCGFLALYHFKGTDYSVFMGGQTTHKPKSYFRPEPTMDAAVAAQLPYVLATSRIAHYLMVMARDRDGACMQAHDYEEWFNSWLSTYVAINPNSISRAQRISCPLDEARAEVKTTPGKPGSYTATVWLRPWLGYLALTGALPTVFQIPRI